MFILFYKYKFLIVRVIVKIVFDYIFLIQSSSEKESLPFSFTNTLSTAFGTPKN